MPDVLCFGNLQLDVLCRPLTSLPAPGELRMIDAIDFQLSGNGGNVAAALGRLGVSVDLAGCRGDDVIGESFRGALVAQGVGVDKLMPCPGASTGTSIMAIAPNGERSITFVNGANAHVDLDAVPDAWLDSPRVVSVGSVFVLPRFTGEAVGRLFARTKARGAVTVLNVCWDSEDRGLPFLAPALPHVDYLVLSYDEGRLLTGQALPERILEELEARTNGTVILTLGADGCLVRGRDGFARIPAVAARAVDCTGAGDTFVAGFIAGLVKGRDTVDCARLACRVAAFAVTGPGSYPRIPTLDEIEGRDAAAAPHSSHEPTDRVQSAQDRITSRGERKMSLTAETIAAAPRYAGLERVLDPGLSVGEAMERQRRFAYVERRLMRLLASRVVSVPERDVKALLARLQYEDALHADGWRERVRELRTNKSKLEGAPDEALAILFDEAEHLPGTYPFLAVVTHVLKPALRDAYRAYVGSTNGLADYPSVRLIGQHLADEEEHLRLLESALASVEVGEGEQELGDDWRSRLDAYLVAAGGIDGTAIRGVACPRSASAEHYRIPHELARDVSLPRVWDFVAPPLEEVPAHLDYMMALRLSEINVSEGLALVLYETDDMAWSFYLDIARHCWDEMRHSLFGEAGAEATYGDRGALPLRDYEGVYAMKAPPLEQYAVLGLEIEGKNMKYPPGKRQEWEFARDMAAHPLMTTFQDFDWADEVLHVNIARRQLDGWFEGGLATIGAFSKEGKAHRTRVKEQQAPTPIPHPSPRAGRD